MKKEFLIDKRDFLKLPNILSFIRILLVPLFVYLYFSEHKCEAIIVLLLSALSDMADGFIARHFGLITELGKILDPFADKLNQASIAVSLAINFPQVAPLLAIFVAKELCMLIGGFYLLRRGEKPVAAKWWGKLATVVFYTVMAVILVFGDNVFGYQMPPSVITVLVGVAAVFMIYSFINYIPMFLNLKSGKASDEEK